MPQPATQDQYRNILHLQGLLGGSRKFVEPKLAYGEHPVGWQLTAENAPEILRLLRTKLQDQNPNQVLL